MKYPKPRPHPPVWIRFIAHGLLAVVFLVAAWAIVVLAYAIIPQ